MFLPMVADIFYGVRIQKPSGQIERSWSFGKTEPCDLKSGTVSSNQGGTLQTYNDFFIIPTILYGRFPTDIRMGENGIMHPITEVLITNIRNRATDQILFEQAKDGDDNPEPVIYELRNISPFINMWGNAEHFKVQLSRSDNQEVF